ncbi:GNAT family N-acetyltransferase [Haloglomus litoreum]|uniref:GNAT family N-acetyltransferase n=1 Tax=Haloglomus litoreum TaxID=3034026 RepID=UPI0023E86882|nr:GNAT family N-acetyltransferase [Haloglomus sp. DT116]
MIREATVGDAALIAEEFWYPLAQEMEPYSALNELCEDALERATAGFEELLAADQRWDFLLETDGAAVGYVSAEADTRATRTHDSYLAIPDLYVKPGFRGEGHGTALLERVERLAEVEGCEFITLGTEWANDRARAFYEANGYEPKQVEYAKLVA